MHTRLYHAACHTLLFLVILSLAACGSAPPAPPPVPGPPHVAPSPPVAPPVGSATAIPAAPTAAAAAAATSTTGMLALVPANGAPAADRAQLSGTSKAPAAAQVMQAGAAGGASRPGVGGVAGPAPPSGARGSATNTVAAAAPTSAPGSGPPAPPPAPGAFVATTQDHLSTFGLDVDTGSYTAARGYLNAGQLPPADLVRVEEFLNYFHYDYPAPVGDAAFGINVDAAPWPYGDHGTQVVRVGIQGQRIDDRQRKPAVLTFVVDTSGSMGEPNRLPLVKDALRTLVGALHDGDEVAVVAFDNQPRVVLNYTGLAGRDTILQAIDSLETGGSTYMEAGLQVGYQMAAQHFKPGTTNRVILCSDGEANVGATGPDPILETIRRYAAQDVLLTSVGFGLGDYNDGMMQRLADHANGNYAFVDTPAAARRVFVANLTGTLQVIAKDAKIQVDFNPAVVRRYRLLGYEKRALAAADFRNNQVDAGEVGAGQSVTALYEVELASAADGPALTVQVRYADPRTGKVRELAQPFTRAEFGRDFAAAAPHLQLAAAVAGFAEALRAGTADAPRLAAVQALAGRLVPQFPNDPDVQEFARLVAQAAALQH